MTVRRGVGFCEVLDCEEFAKQVFLLNHGEYFYCPRCRERGNLVEESGYTEGQGDTWAKSIVEYNYCPVERRYRETAIVQDNSVLPPYKTHVLLSPLIKTEKRALKVAETLLANLTWFDRPVTIEQVVQMDLPWEEYRAQLDQVLSKRGIAP